MGFWTLFEVASMPILQMLLISVLGALMATNYFNILHSDTRKSLNKIVFVVFTPSITFASLTKTVTLDDIISWWFMPINIGLTFLVGGILGWLVVKILKPEVHLEGLIIATCSTGNLGNLLLLVIPAICKEDGSPFGDHEICASVGLSYVSFSMAVGGFYIWTYTYHLIRSSSVKFKAIKAENALKKPNMDLVDANEKSLLLQHDDTESQMIKVCEVSSWSKIARTLNKIVEELLAPPTIAAILGLIFGSITWLKNLIIGSNAPLRVIQDTVKLLGDGTIPCITLILGGNLTQGLKKAKVKPMIIIAVVCVRYIISPLLGILVLKAASKFGFLAADPLYKFVLMIQYTLPPAMNIGTMTQLFDVAQEECSVLFLWTYLAAAFALTIWSTIFMWLLF
ncbi:protein PIN-LIKES 7-like isoform X1 [Solanum stenotomum]|uniref:protein PIN-LIKES 7-like isoform X1 n=2 Tax=Solanum stenotomum TaxID=172797 RepID=UPI0020D05976|nr:protein PIN-LIKES 7-like isoform X1 [Solanum stenotomum]